MTTGTISLGELSIRQLRGWLNHGRGHKQTWIHLLRRDDRDLEVGILQAAHVLQESAFDNCVFHLPRADRLFKQLLLLRAGTFLSSCDKDAIQVIAVDE